MRRSYAPTIAPTCGAAQTTWAIDRVDQGSYAYGFNGVQADIHGEIVGGIDSGLQQLVPCTGGHSSTGIPVANIQQSSVGVPDGIVQIVAGQNSDTSAMYFCYTLFDNSGGDCYNWADGTTTFVPIVGHSYEMTILNYHPASGYRWFYEIWDRTTGYAEFKDTAATWTSGQVVWYGFESHNVNDVLGVRTGANRTYVAPSWFRRRDSDTLIHNAGMTPHVVSSPGSPQIWFHAAPVWWDTPGDGVYATTDSH